jgi:hypothetical protein
MLPPALKLRNVQVAEHMSQETLAFTADLELYGKPIGSVRNDGTGGCHTYAFTNVKGRNAFNRLVQIWAAREKVTFEPEDKLVSDLVERAEIGKDAAALARRTHATRVLCVRKQPVRLESEPEARPIGWAETYLIPLPDDANPQEVAAAEQADEHFVISVGTAA